MSIKEIRQQLADAEEHYLNADSEYRHSRAETQRLCDKALEAKQKRDRLQIQLERLQEAETRAAYGKVIRAED